MHHDQQLSPNVPPSIGSQLHCNVTTGPCAACPSTAGPSGRRLLGLSTSTRNECTVTGSPSTQRYRHFTRSVCHTNTPSSRDPYIDHGFASPRPDLFHVTVKSNIKANSEHSRHIISARRGKMCSVVPNLTSSIKALTDTVRKLGHAPTTTQSERHNYLAEMNDWIMFYIVPEMLTSVRAATSSRTNHAVIINTSSLQ